jgi:hypothetical protein
MMLALSRMTSHDMLSGNALNVWWMVTWLVRSLDSLSLGWWTAFTLPVRILTITRFMQVGYPNPKPFGALLVVVALALMLWHTARGLWRAGGGTPQPQPAARRLADWCLLAGWCVCIYAMLNTQVHENHAYLAVPFLAVAAGADRTVRPLFWAISAVTAYNMFAFYGLGMPDTRVIDRGWTGIDLTVLVSALNVWLVWRLTRRAWRLTPSA